MTRTPDRFETHRPMLLAGARRSYSFAEGPQEIPGDWDRFVRRLPLPGQVGVTTYGVTCGADMAAGTFEYMPAVEVETFDGLDAELGRVKAPGAHYAVFVHAGPISGIRHTIQAAYGWLASNGEWQDGETPPFERYGPDYEPTTGRDVEVWLPVVKI